MRRAGHEWVYPEAGFAQEQLAGYWRNAQCTLLDELRRGRGGGERCDVADPLSHLDGLDARELASTVTVEEVDDLYWITILLGRNASGVAQASLAIMAERQALRPI